MNWLIDLIKTNSRTAGAFAIGLAVGLFVARVEVSFAQQRQDHKSLEEITAIVQAQEAKARSDAKAEKAKWEFIRKACILKTLNDPDKCAEAEAMSE